MVRFAADTLNGVPSIVIGVFAYGVAVLPFRQFSALAGGLALGIMMIPIIARTTEELLLLVPGAMREGALALGATRARAVFTVIVPSALPGIITGIVLALARVAGETAPLLFTSFNNRFFTSRLTEPISSITVQVFTYAISPYEDWHRQAWAGALVLVTFVLVCSLLARCAARVRDSRTMTVAPRPMRSSSRPESADASGRSTESQRRRVKIDVEQLSFFYGTKRALEEISIRIHPNVVTAFIGPSGCGKSTFLRTLNRMNDIVAGARVEGKVCIDGDDIYACRRRLRSRCAGGSGWCSRSRTRFRSRSSRTSRTACVSTAWPRNGGAGRRVEESLKQAALWDEVKDRLQDSALAMSGGQQQRLCIARALAVRPDILLMDEPASALDPIATQRIEELVYDLKKTYTIVIVTHNMQQAARVSDYTAFFWLGKLVEYDRTETIFTAPAEKLTEDYVTGRFG